ncbi:hypothetical protein PHYPO_G00106580 [Pangasianodon hypophthalmus]|uniref:Uncharacterized protein n=1 Tax=Pangasianodon hypophthalmus TaxID=310915 RepID=A0A5N5PYZ4_PANHP|nr:hypothetical protein PHYPO_G00106580 [Pangasianodon hypophthalmus]
MDASALSQDSEKLTSSRPRQRHRVSLHGINPEGWSSICFFQRFILTVHKTKRIFNQGGKHRCCSLPHS